jgi:Caenorhabditis protein of unknown function, DUF268
VSRFRWPTERSLDARFDHMQAHVSAAAADVGARVSEQSARTQESISYVGVELSRQTAALDAHGGALASFEAGIGGLAARLDEVNRLVVDTPFAHALGTDPSSITPAMAGFLNWLGSPTGFATASGLAINSPVGLHYEEGQVRWAGTNERIIEIPFVLQALAAVDAGGRVLDVGSCESLIALHLATCGYQTTALDLHEYPFTHPNLECVAMPLDEWDPDGIVFDAAVCLSSIEHFGLGSYGGEEGPSNADRHAVERLQTMVRPGGMLVLTVPFGEASTDDFERTYDLDRLDQLLAGWIVERRVFAVHSDNHTWQIVEPESVGGRNAVAMLTARRGT